MKSSKRPDPKFNGVARCLKHLLIRIGWLFNPNFSIYNVNKLTEFRK